jgi:hypothetical protein
MIVFNHLGARVVLIPRKKVRLLRRATPQEKLE